MEGALPEVLDDDKLKATIEALLDANDAKLVTLYLTVFNLQTTNGWNNLEGLLESDERLTLS